MLDQNLGTIQGSKTGPLYFDIYSNDLNHLFNAGECLLYADDVALTFVGDDIVKLVQQVNQRLDQILDWCRFNKMSINATKSEYILVTNKKIAFAPAIFLGTNQIVRKKSVKYLGIYIDDKLKFQDHLTFLKNKLAQL